MLETEADEIVWKYLKPLRWILGLQEWRVDVTYTNNLEGGNIADCGVKPEYKSAHIRIDPHMHADEADVAETLLHELLHIFTADFQTYRSMVGQLISVREMNALDEMFDHACETSRVRAMDALVTCMGFDAKKLKRLAERKLEKAWNEWH